MQGIGNDYVYVNCFEEEVKDPAAMAVRVSDRHFGIGADGLILICPSETCDVRMRMFNADGSEGKMCGNGARCVAKYAYDHGICRKETFTLETLGGVKTIKVFTENGKVKTAAVDMGKAVLTGPVPEPITVNGEEKEMIAVDVGNPHAVYYVPSKEALMGLDLEKTGPGYEHHPRFPEGVNSEFIYAESRDLLWMRVWERGSGETLACGTGATASAYASMVSGRCGNRVTVRLLGGDLVIERTDDGHLIMTGPAEEVFTGEFPD